MAYRERLTKTRVWDFSTLDAETQHTVTDVVERKAGTPIVVANPSVQLRSRTLWYVLGIGGLIALMLAAIPGWASLEPRPYLDLWLLPFLLGGAAVAVGIAGLLHRKRALGALPFPPGVYVLPTLLLDARRPVLRLRPLSDLLPDAERAVSGSNGRVVLTFSDGEAFSFPTDDSPEDVRRQLDGLRKRTATAQAEGDEEDLRILQPFQTGDYGADDDVTSSVADRRRGWSDRAWLLMAAGLGCFVGVGVREAREYVSESRAIEHAHTTRHADGLWRYLDNGGRLRDRADRVLLELATQQRENAALLKYLKVGRDAAEADRRLFERAREEGSAVALEMYLAAGKEHRDEAERKLLDLARTSNLRSDFERYLAVAQHDTELVRKKLLPEADIAAAKDPEAVLALRHHLDEDVAPDVKEQIRARIDALYAKELKHFDKIAGQASGRELVAVMLERLAKGKPVAVVLQSSFAPDLDERIAAFLRSNGDGVSPKDFLAQTAKIDASLRLSATHGLHRVFDPHVVPVVAEHEDPAARLLVRYRVSATDTVWVTERQKKTFLSLRLHFDIELSVPGVERRLRGETTFEADRIWYRRHSGRTPYTRMFENAGTQLEAEVERLTRE